MEASLGALAEVIERGGRAAVATVIRTWRSAPLPAGTSMVVTSDGAIVGSVSGGCVESDVVEVCRQVLASGKPTIVSYGVSDEQAFAVGLMCGGTIDLLVERVDVASWPLLAGAARQSRDEPLAIATVVDGDSMGARAVISSQVTGSLGAAELDAAVLADARELMISGRSACQRYEEHAAEVLIETRPRPASLVIVGSSDFATALATIGKALGYTVLVVDPRGAFATPERIPAADEIAVAWPDRWLSDRDLSERDAVVVLTHDPKLDVPALSQALRTGTGYVGAMGSRATHADRVRRLLAAGVPGSDIDRIRGPIGLDIGGQTPMETAISIAAEIIALRNGRAGGPLGAGNEAIHAARRHPSGP